MRRPPANTRSSLRSLAPALALAALIALLLAPNALAAQTPLLTPQTGSGPLYAVRVVTSGTGGLSAPVISLLPVASALTAITLPPVKDSYTAVLP